MTEIAITGNITPDKNKLYINQDGRLTYIVYGSDQKKGIDIKINSCGVIAGVVGNDIIIVSKTVIDKEILIVTISSNNETEPYVNHIGRYEDSNPLIYHILKSIGILDNKALDMLPFFFFKNED